VAAYGRENALPVKKRVQTRIGAMWKERSTWIKRYTDITQYMLPYAGRYCSNDRNRGDRTFNSIYDETATYALDVLSAGMMAGMTSPARPWFQLAISDRELMEYQPVKEWLSAVSQDMRDIFAQSNTYNSLHAIYEELGAFGTAGTIIEDDFETVIHHNVLTAGEYGIAVDARGRVSTVAREFDMTVEQIVGKFVFSGQPYGPADWTRVSPAIKEQWDKGNYDTWITVQHLIQPRTDRDLRKLDNVNMAFESCYIEKGRDDGDDRCLRESGYNKFPGLFPRWKVRGGDIYGEAPSFRTLGSVKQLQQQQLRKGQAIDYMVKPPLQVPVELRNSMGSTLPGGVSYVPSTANTGGIKSAFDVNVNLSHLTADMIDVRDRINRGFYVDLFLMISQDNRRTPATATEIAERHEEKLLMIGPTLERLHNEMLAPKIEMTFARQMAVGMLPPMPRELQDMPVKIEFISTLAQAQKMVGLASLDRLMNTVNTLAAGKQDPSVWDKIDTDQAIDRYGDMLGTDPTIIRSDDNVVQMREARAQMAQQQLAQQQAAQAAATAKDMASADTSQPNALTDILGQVQGYNARV
jgi:hypothetical protein